MSGLPSVLVIYERRRLDVLVLGCIECKDANDDRSCKMPLSPHDRYTSPEQGSSGTILMCVIFFADWPEAAGIIDSAARINAIA
ncbi:hypothetical protein CFR79_09045 [Komagataeibacter saccharivorans]|nr:hypothetical protein CFR79_09045 [Komagataeibacter saccharivorans]